jgi:signal transduction histidine kinase
LHKLLQHQLRKIAGAGGSVDPDALIAVIERTYTEFDRERRLNNRAAKLMEEELQEANDRVRRMGDRRLAETLESVPNAIVLLNEHYVVQNMNAAMAALCAHLARPPEIGMTFTNVLAALLPFDDVDTCLRELFDGDALEVQIGKDWYLGLGRRLSDGSLALSLPRITALKEREATLALARDAAESANRLKSKFLATMSHELRTPLNAILGFSEIIQNRVLGNDRKAWERYSDYADSIHASGAHLLLLISEVLDLSKIESGLYRLCVGPVDIASLVRDALLLVEPQARQGAVTILPLRQDGDATVQADARAIKQVIVNLLSNAVKFTAPGGRVEIEIRQDGDIVELRVRDTGIGIAPELLDSIFEPFHQGDAMVARRYEGTGLGLSVSRGLLEMHNGSIRMESRLGEGTAAIVRLPQNMSAAAPVGQVA